VELEAVMGKDVHGFTSEELDEIAGRARAGCGFYSWRTVYQEFLRAGLTSEEAKRATDERVMVLD
jgi:hypothetical protein